MNNDSRTAGLLNNKSKTQITLFFLFILIFIIAWISQYPTFYSTIIVHESGHAVTGLLLEGRVNSFSVVPDVLPWNVGGGANVSNDTNPIFRVFMGPSVNVLLIAVMIPIIIFICGLINRDSFKKLFVITLLESIIFWCGFDTFKEFRNTLPGSDIMVVLNSVVNPEFFKTIFYFVSTFGLVVMFYVLIHWLIIFMINMKYIKISNHQNKVRAFIAIISIFLAFLFSLIPMELILIAAPLIMIFILALVLFSQTHYVKNLLAK